VKGRNIKAIISYDGTDFFGWQTQPALRTIQGVLEEKTSWLLSEEVRLFAAGRTDKGVHASGQVVNFFTDRAIPLENLRLALNLSLPRDIFIKKVAEVSPDFHARYSAKHRTYRYRLGLWGQSRSPFLSRYCWYPGESLDIGAIERAIPTLEGKHDFSKLAKRSELGDNTVCEVQAISWERMPSGYSLRVTADRFLPQMMRRILAMLIDIGSGKQNPALIGEVLDEGRENWTQPWVAPPQGLFLKSVEYRCHDV